MASKLPSIAERQGTGAVKPLSTWAVDLLGVLTLLTMVAALYGAFIYAPEEAVQGPPQRIFYLHVPLAWVAYLAFFVVFVASVGYLWRGEERWDRLARSSAEVGVVFTTLVLITGSIWARPIWGVWWTWEPRLTLTVVLWLIYVAYLMLRSMAGESPRVARYAAVLGIVGAVDIPFIHFAVTWWRGQHPPPTVLRPEGPDLPASMLIALMVSLCAFTLLYCFLLLQRVRWDGAKEMVEEMKGRLSRQGGR